MLEIAESRQCKIVFFCQCRYRINLSRIQVSPQCKILIPAFQGKYHGFRHTGKTGLGRKTEVKPEIHISGDMNHAAFDHQHIIPERRHIPGYIAGPGHITYHGAGFQIRGINNKINCAGNRNNDIRFMQAFFYILTH